MCSLVSVCAETPEPLVTSLPDQLPAAGTGDAGGPKEIVRNTVRRMSGRKMSWRDSAAAKALRDEMTERYVWQQGLMGTRLGVPHNGRATLQWNDAGQPVHVRRSQCIQCI